MLWNDGSEATAADHDYVLKGLIKLGKAAIVGPSGAGKTSLAIDLCFQIARGQNYQGRRVKQRPVLYVGYEGLSGLKDCISAAVRMRGDPGKQFARLTISPSQKVADRAKGTQKIIAAARLLMREAEAKNGCVIIIDTKARATAGDDENSAADASTFIEGPNALCSAIASTRSAQ